MTVGEGLRHLCVLGLQCDSDFPDGFVDDPQVVLDKLQGLWIDLLAAGLQRTHQLLRGADEFLLGSKQFDVHEAAAGPGGERYARRLRERCAGGR